MVATRGRTFKRPWRRSCHSSKLKSSSAPIGRKDSWCFHGVGSSNAPLLGSTAAEGLQRIGRTSIATRWRFCGLPQSASCSENFVIPPDVFGQTLSLSFLYLCALALLRGFVVCNRVLVQGSLSQNFRCQLPRRCQRERHTDHRLTSNFGLEVYRPERDLARFAAGTTKPHHPACVAGGLHHEIQSLRDMDDAALGAGFELVGEVECGALHELSTELSTAKRGPAMSPTAGLGCILGVHLGYTKQGVTACCAVLATHRNISRKPPLTLGF